MMTRCGASPGPCWNYYIAVDSVATAAEWTTECGGQVLHAPHQVPGGAWIVKARDPQGASFAMISGAR
jgi:predicted enzyme related to lactoylglutathione lyase